MPGSRTLFASYTPAGTSSMASQGSKLLQVVTLGCRTHISTYQQCLHTVPAGLTAVHSPAAHACCLRDKTLKSGLLCMHNSALTPTHIGCSHLQPLLLVLLCKGQLVCPISECDGVPAASFNYGGQHPPLCADTPAAGGPGFLIRLPSRGPNAVLVCVEVWRALW